MLISHEVMHKYQELNGTKIFLIEENAALRNAWDLTIKTSKDVLSELFKLPFDKMFLELKQGGLYAGCSFFQYLPNGYKDITSACVFITWFGRDGHKGLFRQGVRFLITDKLDVLLLLEKEQKDLDELQEQKLKSHAWALICQVCLINSPKIIDTITKPALHNINKSRLHKGKPPITEYHIIKLKPEIEAQFLESEKNAASGKMPFHWRRGHFKALPCGLRWWNAHTVGKKENGEIVSGYLMEGA